MTTDQPIDRKPRPGVALLILLRRELLVELRTRSLLTSMGLFALLEIVVVGLGVRALPADETFSRFVPAVLWVCMLFAAVVGINRSALADRDKNLHAAFLLLPYDPTIIYMARLVSTFVFLSVVEAVQVVAAVPLLRFDIPREPWLLAVLALTNIGVLAPGILLASATSQARGGEALLTIMLLPVIVVVFMGAAGATDSFLGGLGFEGAQSYLLLLCICAAMFPALGLLLYGRLHEG